MAWETRSTQAAPGARERMTWKQGFEEDRHMYKKHGRDRKTSLELQVKALVVKALEEQGLSMETRILVTPPGELALVGSLRKVLAAKVSLQPQPQSITYGNELVAPWYFSAASRTL